MSRSESGRSPKRRPSPRPGAKPKSPKVRVLWMAFTPDGHWAAGEGLTREECKRDALGVYGEEEAATLTYRAFDIRPLASRGRKGAG